MAAATEHGAEAAATTATSNLSLNNFKLFPRPTKRTHTAKSSSQQGQLGKRRRGVGGLAVRYLERGKQRLAVVSHFHTFSPSYMRFKFKFVSNKQTINFAYTKERCRRTMGV